MEEGKNKDISELDAMKRLAEILNDSPQIIKLGGREFPLKPLRYGAQWLIAEESCKIAKADETFSDIVNRFAANGDAVIRCICIAILNDKEKIEGKEYQDLWDFIRWETNPSEWIIILTKILQMLDYATFCFGCEVIHSLRQSLTKTHQQQSSPQPHPQEK
ncbi:MAG: hypothetical protein K2N48_00185 [Muribaculaceae bacterium]|nr:hypothetical protein [Muribaculaceae bacterium]